MRFFFTSKLLFKIEEGGKKEIWLFTTRKNRKSQWKIKCTKIGKITLGEHNYAKFTIEKQSTSKIERGSVPILHLNQINRKIYFSTNFWRKKYAHLAVTKWPSWALLTEWILNTNLFRAIMERMFTSWPGV